MATGDRPIPWWPVNRERQMFVYGRSYLDRENAGTIHEAELPLRTGGA